MTGPVITEALVEALIAGLDATEHCTREGQAAELIAGPLAPILAALQRVTAERDEAREVVARLRAEGEAKDRALKPFADFSARHISADGHWWVTKAHTRNVSATFRSEDFNAARTALARAATAREG